MDILRETIEIYAIPDLTNIVLEWYSKDYISFTYYYIIETLEKYCEDGNYIMFKEVLLSSKYILNLSKSLYIVCSKNYKDMFKCIFNHTCILDYIYGLQGAIDGNNLEIVKEMYYLSEKVYEHRVWSNITYNNASKDIKEWLYNELYYIPKKMIEEFKKEDVKENIRWYTRFWLFTLTVGSFIVSKFE